MTNTLFDGNKEKVKGNFSLPSEVKEISPNDLNALIQLCIANSPDIEETFFETHLGEESTFTYKKEVLEGLDAIYSYIQSLSPEQDDIKNNILFKISERVRFCTAGFHTGIQEILISIFNEPQSLEDCLALIRQDIVTSYAAQATDEVHRNNLIFQIASENHKTIPINSKDTYINFNADERTRINIKEDLKKAFDEHYQFFPIIENIKARLVTTLMIKGYSKGSDFREHLSSLNLFLAKIFPFIPKFQTFLETKQKISSNSQETELAKKRIQDFVGDLFAKYPKLSEFTDSEMQKRIEALINYPNQEGLDKEQKAFIQFLSEDLKKEVVGLEKTEEKIRDFIVEKKLHVLTSLERRKLALAGNEAIQKHVPYDELLTLISLDDKEHLSSLISTWQDLIKIGSDLNQSFVEQNESLTELCWNIDDMSIREDTLLEFIIKGLNDKGYTDLSEDFINQLIQIISQDTSKDARNAIVQERFTHLSDIDKVHITRFLDKETAIELLMNDLQKAANESDKEKFINIIRYVSNYYPEILNKELIEKIKDSQNYNHFCLGLFIKSPVDFDRLIPKESIDDQIFEELCKNYNNEVNVEQKIDKNLTINRKCNSLEKLKIIFKYNLTIHIFAVKDFFTEFGQNQKILEWMKLYHPAALVPQFLMDKVTTLNIENLNEEIVKIYAKNFFSVYAKDSKKIDKLQSAYQKFQETQYADSFLVELFLAAPEQFKQLSIVMTDELFSKICKQAKEFNQNTTLDKFFNYQYLYDECNSFERVQILIKDKVYLSDDKFEEFFNSFGKTKPLEKWMQLRTDVPQFLMNKIKTSISNRENLNNEIVEIYAHNCSKGYSPLKLIDLKAIYRDLQLKPYANCFLAGIFLADPFNFILLQKSPIEITDDLYKEICRQAVKWNKYPRQIFEKCNTLSKLEILLSEKVPFNQEAMNTIRKSIRESNNNKDLKQEITQKMKASMHLYTLLDSKIKISSAIDDYDGQIWMEVFEDIARHHPNAKIEYNASIQKYHNLNKQEKLKESLEKLNSYLVKETPQFQSFFSVIQKKEFPIDRHQLNQDLLELYNITQDLKDESKRANALTALAKKIDSISENGKNQYHLGHYILGNFLMALLVFTIIVPICIKYCGYDYWYHEDNHLTRAVNDLHEDLTSSPP